LYVSGKNESINYIEDEEELNVLLNKNRIMKKNIDLIRKPNATRDVCEFLVNLDK